MWNAAHSPVWAFSLLNVQISPSVNHIALIVGLTAGALMITIVLLRYGHELLPRRPRPEQQRILRRLISSQHEHWHITVRMNDGVTWDGALCEVATYGTFITFYVRRKAHRGLRTTQRLRIHLDAWDVDTQDNGAIVLQRNRPDRPYLQTMTRHVDRIVATPIAQRTTPRG